MPPTPLKSIVKHCDRLLENDTFKDYEGAVNGLQVENRGSVSRIAAAVSASLGIVPGGILRYVLPVTVLYTFFIVLAVPALSAPARRGTAP